MSEKFSGLREEAAETTRQVREANIKIAQESKEKQGYIEKLNAVEQNNRRNMKWAKLMLRTAKENNLLFKTDDGRELTEEDIQ